MEHKNIRNMSLVEQHRLIIQNQEVILRGIAAMLQMKTSDFNKFSDEIRQRADLVKEIINISN